MRRRQYVVQRSMFVRAYTISLSERLRLQVGNWSGMTLEYIVGEESTNRWADFFFTSASDREWVYDDIGVVGEESTNRRTDFFLTSATGRGWVYDEIGDSRQGVEPTSFLCREWVYDDSRWGVDPPSSQRLF